MVGLTHSPPKKKKQKRKTKQKILKQSSERYWSQKEDSLLSRIEIKIRGVGNLF